MMKPPTFAKRIAQQRDWIAARGGSLQGYLAFYGRDPLYSGRDYVAEVSAIYEADREQLRALLREQG